MWLVTNTAVSRFGALNLATPNKHVTNLLTVADSVSLAPNTVAFGRFTPSFEIPKNIFDSQYHHYSPPAVTDANPYGFSEEILGAQDIAKQTLEQFYKLPSDPHGGLVGELETSLNTAYTESNRRPLNARQAQDGYAPLLTTIQKLGESGVLGVNLHPRVQTERPDIYNQFLSLGPVGNAAVASTVAIYGDMSLATTSLASVGLAADPIGALATNDFHWQAYQEIKSGEVLGAYALTEPQKPGSNPAAITATAIEENGQVHFDEGQKMWITNGNIAKYILITARVKRDGKELLDSKGRPVLNAYLISRDELLEGATDSVGHKLSIEKSDTANVYLDKIKPFDIEKHQLGPDGAGTTIYRDILSDGRVNVGMATAALAQAALRKSIDYSKGRGTYYSQSRDMLANGMAMTEAAQLLALHAARLKEHVETLKHNGNTEEAKKVNAEFVQAASVAKLFTTHWAAPKALRDSIQVHGGMGIAVETGLAEPFKDTVVAGIYEGASEIQQNLIFGMTLGNLNTTHGKKLTGYLLNSLQKEPKTVFDVLQKAENLAIMICLIAARGQIIKDLMDDPTSTLQHYTAAAANIITFNGAVKQLAASIKNREIKGLDASKEKLYLDLLLHRSLEESVNNLTKVGAFKAQPDNTGVALSKKKPLLLAHKALSWVGLGSGLEKIVDSNFGLNRQRVETELRNYQNALHPINTIEALMERDDL